MSGASKGVGAAGQRMSTRGVKCLSPEEAKAKVYEKGMTLREFAKANGLNYRTVSEVIRGVNKGLFGEGHRAAVALGIKRG